MWALFPLLFNKDAKFLSVGFLSDFQSDLIALYERTNRNSMLFKINKCSLMKMCKNEKQLLFGIEVIENEEAQSGFGLKLFCDIKWKLHIIKFASKPFVFSLDKKKRIKSRTKAKLNLQNL